MKMVIKGKEINAYLLNKNELQEIKVPANLFVAKDMKSEDIYYIIHNEHRELVSGIHQIL